MEAMLFLRIGACVTGVLVAGEALAFLGGRRGRNGDSRASVSPRHDPLLAADLVLGAGLIVAAARDGVIGQARLIGIAVGLALVVHGYRLWRSLAGAMPPLYATRSLRALSGAKLVALLLVALAAVGITFGFGPF